VSPPLRQMPTISTMVSDLRIMPALWTTMTSRARVSVSAETL
jgi:hypothetical protein